MKSITLVAAIVLMTGCATQTYTMSGDTTDAAPKQPTKEISQTFWVEGIGQQKVLDAAQVCGGADKVIKVESKETFLDGLYGVLTLGIYTPRTAKVYCKG